MFDIETLILGWCAWFAFIGVIFYFYTKPPKE